MKKCLRSLICLLSILILTSNSTFSVFAIPITSESEKNTLDEYSTYEDILQSLGKEYGLEVWLGSSTNIGRNEFEMQKGVVVDYTKFTMEEFEALVREDLSRIAKHNSEIIKEYEKDGSDFNKAVWIKSNNLDDSTSNITRSQKSYYSKKKYNDLNVTLSGIVNDNSGYWTFTQVDSSSADRLSATENYKSESYTVKFLDSRRTAGVTYNGVEYHAIGDYYVNNVKEYAEFYAGSK